MALAGCVSAGGAVTVNRALDDRPARAGGSALRLGTMAELVEDRAVGQLLYAREAGPLGDRATPIGLWGARLTTMSHGRRPGLFFAASYGRAREGTTTEAASLAVGAGIAYSRLVTAGPARAWMSLQLGVAYHRQHQLDVDGGARGDFLGIELGFMAGVDSLGAMFAR